MEWFKSVGRLIADFFAGSSTFLPQLIVLVGAVVWLAPLAAHFFVGSTTLDAMLPYQSLVSTVVASGFFAWVTKSILFRGVMQHELTTLVYQPDHLAKRTDKDQLLLNTIVANGVPLQIAQLAAAPMLERLWRPERPYHYAELRRRHDITWHDADAGIVRNHTTQMMLICFDIGLDVAQRQNPSPFEARLAAAAFERPCQLSNCQA